MYRPHSDSVLNFETELRELLNHNLLRDSKVIIVGTGYYYLFRLLLLGYLGFGYYWLVIIDYYFGYYCWLLLTAVLGIALGS